MVPQGPSNGTFILGLTLLTLKTLYTHFSRRQHKMASMACLTCCWNWGLGLRWFWMKESRSLLGICDRSGPIHDPAVEMLELPGGVRMGLEILSIAASWTVFG